MSGSDVFSRSNGHHEDEGPAEEEDHADEPAAEADEELITADGDTGVSGDEESLTDTIY